MGGYSTEVGPKNIVQGHLGNRLHDAHTDDLLGRIRFAPHHRHNDLKAVQLARVRRQTHHHTPRH
jgi:hypothetical protein